jgi:hypothetical protein
MNFEQRIQDMLKMADEIANRAEAQADDFRNVSGDVALRQFADAIRKTNKAAASIPSPIN